MKSRFPLLATLLLCACNPVLPVQDQIVTAPQFSSASSRPPLATSAASQDHQQRASAASAPNVGEAPRNCSALGGTLRTERKPPRGAEFTVCILPGGNACEADALETGRCPMHGVPTAGLTPAARYCRLIGGAYRADGVQGEEQGTCTIRNSSCNVWELWDGRCSF